MSRRQYRLSSPLYLAELRSMQCGCKINLQPFGDRKGTQATRGKYSMSSRRGLTHSSERHKPKRVTQLEGKNLFKKLFSKEYVTVDRVPDQYREPFILTGYRQPYSSFLDCIVSAFRLNNETFNIWTHFIPFVAFIFFFWSTFPSKLWPLSAIEPRYYPLLSEQVSVLAYLLCSSIAHTFNCMSPKIRHTCFYIDYVAICMFGSGTASATFYYLRSLNFDFFLYRSANLFIGLNSLLCLGVAYVLCMSRHKWEKHKYQVRTIAFLTLFVYTHAPSLYRHGECIFTRKECTQGLNYLLMLWITFLGAAFFNASRLPERLFPATFDIIGHNHQIMHMLSAFGTLAHFWGIHVDLSERKDSMDTLLNGLTVYTALGWSFTTLAITFALAMWFSYNLTPSGKLKC